MIWTEKRKAAALACLASWRSVRHSDRMASREHGIDCIHLVYEVLIAAEILPRRDLPRYDTRIGMGKPNDQLKRSIERSIFATEMFATIEFGDILVFKNGKSSAHCGIATGATVWHALARRCVTESPMWIWQNKIENILRITKDGFRNGGPEVADP